MKITRKQIRELIKESLIAESYMKERFGEIQSSIDSVVHMTPGLGGLEIVNYVLSDLSDYGMADPAMAIAKEDVFEVLDIMLENGELLFDEENDQWYVAEFM